jgi:hypothetical protein
MIVLNQHFGELFLEIHHKMPVKALQKSFNDKSFEFNKKGAEIILRLYDILKNIKGDLFINGN